MAVHSDIGYAMLVVPANRLVDFQEVRLELGLKQLRMVTEYELGKLFPDCRLGTHNDVIHMLTAEYRRLVRPVIVPLARVEAAHGW